MDSTRISVAAPGPSSVTTSSASSIGGKHSTIVRRCARPAARPRRGTSRRAGRAPCRPAPAISCRDEGDGQRGARAPHEAARARRGRIRRGRADASARAARGAARRPGAPGRAAPGAAPPARAATIAPTRMPGGRSSRAVRLSSRVPHPRVEHGVEQVDHQVDQQEQDRDRSARCRPPSGSRAPRPRGAAAERPGQLNTYSTSTVPPSSVPICRASTVTTGLSALRTTWWSSTRRGDQALGAGGAHMVAATACPAPRRASCGRRWRARPLRDGAGRQREQDQMLPRILRRRGRSRRPASSAASAAKSRISSVPTTKTGTAEQQRRQDRQRRCGRSRRPRKRRERAGRQAEAGTRQRSGGDHSSSVRGRRSAISSRHRSSRRQRDAEIDPQQAAEEVEILRENGPVEAELLAQLGDRAGSGATPPCDSSSSAGSPGTRWIDQEDERRDHPDQAERHRRRAAPAQARMPPTRSPCSRASRRSRGSSAPGRLLEARHVLAAWRSPGCARRGRRSAPPRSPRAACPGRSRGAWPGRTRRGPRRSSSSILRRCARRSCGRRRPTARRRSGGQPVGIVAVGRGADHRDVVLAAVAEADAGRPVGQVQLRLDADRRRGAAARPRRCPCACRTARSREACRLKPLGRPASASSASAAAGS